MNSRLIVFVFLFAVGLLLNSCSKDTSEPALKKYPVSLSFKMPDTNSGSRVQSNDISLVVKALVTITKEDGTATEFTQKVVEVFESEGVFYSEEIDLPAGGYLITELLLVDVEGTSLFAIPTEGNLEEYIDEQLPILFEVTDQSTVKTVVLEVLSTLGFTPEDFGFDPEDVKFEPLLYFRVALRDMYDPDRYLKGDLYIGSDMMIHVDSAAKVVFTKENGFFNDYYIEVLTPHHYKFMNVYSEEFLLKHQEEPLLIELEKIPELGNVYVGNVNLTSQEEVDDFGAKRYDYVKGNIIIDDDEASEKEPIQNLRSLQALLRVNGDFIIKDNPSMVTFSGMILNEVNGDFILTDNPKLEGLEGVENFRKLGGNLTIINNSSLKNYCAISKLFYESPEVQLEIKGNAYNPTKEEIKNYETCSID